MPLFLKMPYKLFKGKLVFHHRLPIIPLMYINEKESIYMPLFGILQSRMKLFANWGLVKLFLAFLDSFYNLSWQEPNNLVVLVETQPFHTSNILTLT